MENKFEQNNCGEDDVLSFGDTMLKVDKLSQEIKNIFDEYKLGHQLNDSLGAKKLHVEIPGEQRHKHYHRFHERWFGDGIDCEILKLRAKGWQKGKVRIKLNVSLEFCPDDELDIEETQASSRLEIGPPESPLDDIRRMIFENGQQGNL